MVSAAVSPSNTGIFTSISTTSGRRARHSSMASKPSPASPSTVKSSSASISARSILVMGSSSTMITVRMVSPLGFRTRSVQAEAALSRPR